MALYDLIKSLVKDGSGKLSDPADYNNAVSAALKHYSKHRPHLVCGDVQGQDGPDVAVPVDWLDGFSIIENIEYPIGSVPEILIDSRDWRFYRTPTDIYIRFAAIKPAFANYVRILYTILHTEATVPADDLEAVASLAASFCLRQLAAAYGNTGDSIIQADVVNYRSKGDEYARRAKELEGFYRNHLGIKDSDTVPAASVTASSPDPGKRDPLSFRLTHLRR